MMRNSVLVVGVMGVMAASAEATFVTGATAFLTGAISASDDKPGSAPATYSASVNSTSPAASATATLVWGAASYAFSGTASGAAGTPNSTFANSQGIAMFTFATAMNVSMSWDFTNIVGMDPSVLAGWSLDDMATGNTAYAIQFAGSSTTPSSIAGGITSATAASGVSGQVAAGTYMLGTAIQIAIPNAGTFTVNLTFTPVPAPGALPLVVAASIVARRRRRR